MKKWVLLVFGLVFGFGAISQEVVIPLDIVTNGSKYATEAKKERDGGYTYDYYKSDNEGKLKRPHRKQVDLTGWDNYETIDITPEPEPEPEEEPEIISEPLKNLIPTYVNTLVPNRVNLEQFPDMLEPVEKFKVVFGQGSPYFKDMQTKPQLPIRKGWDYSYTGGVVGADVVPSENVAAFYNATSNWSYVAQEMYRSKPEKYNDLQHVRADTKYPRLDLVSKESARALGNTLYYYRRGYTNDRFIHSTLWDEEVWSYPAGAKDFVGGLFYGLGNASSNGERHILYGNNYTPTPFRIGDTVPYPGGKSDKEMEEIAKTFNLRNSDFYESGVFADFAVMYFKTPVPDVASYYLKNGNAYVLDSKGRRQFRTDAFKESLFGVETDFYTKPTDMYLQYTTSKHMANAESQKPDAYYAVAQQYQHHDILQLGMIARAYEYGHDGDISHFYDEGIKPYAVVCLNTEPYTPAGNGHLPREIGRAGIESYLAITGFSGVWGFETWQDGSGSEVYAGRHDSPLQVNPKQGERLYFEDASYARFETATAVVQGIKRAFEGIEVNEDLRYFSFSKFLDSYNNREIISQGFYNDGKLGISLVYPFHDANEVTAVTLEFGDKIETVELVGRRPVIFNTDIASGLEPSDLRISYRNVDGVLISVSGDIWDR